MKKIGFILLIVLAAIMGIFIKYFLAFGLLLWVSSSAEIEVYTDASNYELYRSGDNALNQFQSRWGMDESIWPETITSDMTVTDYKMVYYNPWDAQYLGYMVVTFDDYSAYEKELNRLKSYDSTEYIGYYGVTGEEDYELVAINADSYSGFIYAMTDGSSIIYAEQIFCNGYMDLDYSEYIPEPYLLDGFDATLDNDYSQSD